MAESSLFSSFSKDCHAALQECVGTAFFLVLGLGGIQAATAENNSDTQGGASNIEQVMYTSTAMGFSLLVSAWLFFRVTGGLFNPNVSLALLLVGIIRPVRFVLFCLAQLLGAVAASALLLVLTPGPLSVNTSLRQGINTAQGVFIEMFITAALILSVLMLAAEKHHATPFAPVGIGLTLFAAHLFAGFYTGAAMNTARAFGPAVVTGFSTPHHWVYWVGPFLGSLLGASFYATLKHFQYWRLNPDQAAVDTEKSPLDPVDVARTLLPIQNDGVRSDDDNFRRDVGYDRAERMERGETMEGTERVVAMIEVDSSSASTATAAATANIKIGSSSLWQTK